MAIFITINPQFASLRPAIEKLVYEGYTPAGIYRKGRNTVAATLLDGKKVVVKEYGHQDPIRGFIYGIFRQPKALRAYNNALRLLAEGFLTPAPIACAFEKQGGRLIRSWLITEIAEGSLVKDLYIYPGLQQQEREALWKALSKYTYALHSARILPLDYNCENIFYKPAEDGNFEFSLVDINRMRFGQTVSFRQAMRSFEQLNVNAWTFSSALPPYCQLAGYELNRCAYTILRLIRRRRLRKKLLHPLD